MYGAGPGLGAMALTVERRWCPCWLPPPPGSHLQKLRVLLAQLLEQCRQKRRVLLNHLPHVLELGLVPQKLQGVLSH